MFHRSPNIYVCLIVYQSVCLKLCVSNLFVKLCVFKCVSNLCVKYVCVILCVIFCVSKCMILFVCV